MLYRHCAHLTAFSNLLTLLVCSLEARQQKEVQHFLPPPLENSVTVYSAELAVISGPG